MHPKYVYSLKGITGTMLTIMEVLWKYKVSTRLLKSRTILPTNTQDEWDGMVQDKTQTAH